MKELVVDTSVLVSAFYREDPQHETSALLTRQLEAGEVRFHLSTLVPVELCGALITPQRRGGKLVRQALPAEVVSQFRDFIEQWVKAGKIRLHPLTEARMNQAAVIAIRRKLKGPDAVIVQTALELSLPLETYDDRMLTAWQRERRRA